jgi:glutathione S-transferase
LNVDWAGIDIDEFPHLNAWIDRVLARPGVEKGRHVPKKHTALDQRFLTQEQLAEMAVESSKWVMQGMKDDAGKK